MQFISQFFVLSQLEPLTKEPTTVLPNLMAGTFNGAIKYHDAHNTMCWGRVADLPIWSERAKPLRVGWHQLILFVAFGACCVRQTVSMQVSATSPLLPQLPDPHPPLYQV